MRIFELNVSEQPTYWEGWEAAKRKQIKESNPHKDKVKQRLWNEGFDSALQDHQTQQAKYQGYVDCKKKVQRDDNPYIPLLTETTKRDAWYEGWELALNESK